MQLLSCDLDASNKLPGWIVSMDCFDTRHTTVFDLFDCFLFGLMHRLLWYKRRCSVRLASYIIFDLSARVCEKFYRENDGERELRKDHTIQQRHPEEISKSCKVGFI